MNKLVVVTGGTKGIGKAIVIKFAQSGFDVATCSRSRADLDILSAEIKESYAVNVLGFEADLGRTDQVRAFANKVSALKRPVEVLVNNAGYFVPGAALEEEDGTLEKMMSTNLYSAYYLTRQILPLMIGSDKCHIFNMCSIASLIAYPNGGSYTITKFALLGFSKVLREELKPKGIRVTSVLPGATYTASWEGANVPRERLMKADDIAETVFAAYQLSPGAVIEEIVIRPQLGDL